MTTVHQYGFYLVEFQPRAEYQGRPRKPGLEPLIGQRFVADAMWLMDANDPYPEEYAFGHSFCKPEIRKQFMDLRLGWIAQGDLKVIGAVSHTEHPFNNTLHPVPKVQQLTKKEIKDASL